MSIRRGFRSGGFRTRAAAGGNAILELGPWAWYDVLRGGSSSQITDSSPFGRAAATFGAASAAPSYVAGARFVTLDGVDDYIDVPAASVPPLDTFQAPSSVVAVFRRATNPGTAGHPIFTTKSVVTDTALGCSIRMSTAAANTSIFFRVGDGTAGEAPTNPTLALNVRGVAYLQVGNANPYLSGQINNDAAVTDATRSTSVTTSTGGAGRIGAYLGGTAFMPMEFEALISFTRALSTNEIARIVAYYGGGG